MTTTTAGRFRLLSLPLLCLFALVLGGADGCSGNPDLAGARQAVGVEDFDRALTNVNSALAADPDNLDALTLKADVLSQLVRRSADATAKRALLTEMNATVRRSIALNPTDANVGIVRANAWALTVNEANVVLRDETAPEGAAVPLFQTAVEFMPDSSQGHFGIGLAELTRGNATEAIAPLRRAVELAPDDEFSSFYLGRALLAADQGDEAITFLTGASQRFPESTSIRADLLNAYQRTGRSAEALSLYEREIASARYVNEGDRCRDSQNGQFVEANMCTGKTPADLALLQFNYGTVLLNAGRRDEAVTQFEQSIALNPANFDAQYNLGATYQNQGAEANRLAGETDDNAENRRLIGERDVFLERSLPYFQAAQTAASESTSASYEYDTASERCRDISTGQFVPTATCNSDRVTACTALFRVYTALGRTDEARGVSECAGIDMN